MATDPLRLPRNGFERILWLHGRKFWLALFAGVSSFTVTVAGMWIAARVAPETARVVEAIVSAYLLSAAGMVTAYSASNAVVERAHAKHGTGEPPAPRMSGVVAPVEG